MQKALRLFTRYAEVVCGVSIAYFTVMTFFTDDMGKFMALVAPALALGLASAFLIALKNEAEFQRAGR